jgi:hypothetical protein
MRVKKRKEEFTINSHTRYVYSVALSPAETKIIYGGR